MPLNFTEPQAKAVVAAVTVLATGVILFALGSLLWLMGVFLRTFSSVFLPLAVGALMALVIRPYYQWLCERMRLPMPIALAIVFLSILVPLGAFLWFFGGLLMTQLSDMLGKAPGWWNDLVEIVRGRWPQIVEFTETNPLGQRIRGALASQQAALVQGLQMMGDKALSVGSVVAYGISTLFSWAVLPIYFAYFLTRKPKQVNTESLLPFLKAETRLDVVYLAKEFVNIIVVFFRGQLMIAFLQGLLFAFGFGLAGLRYGIVIGLLLGFLNIIPYLGSIVGLSIVLPVAYFQAGGGSEMLLWAMAVFVVVQLVEGYVLTPTIMGNRTGLHFMAIIVAIFFWGVALGGILGMIMAIPLTAFLVSFWHLAREKYIRELV
jgi:predicted PurR-regulated permease PerM